MKLSVIIPCFNEEKVLYETYRRISSVLKNQEALEYEMLFINDGSTDRTQAVLAELSANDRRVAVISFSRNFGHQPAVSAGIRHCQGDLALIIDADLQDPPEVIPDMLKQLILTNSNVVYGVRTSRKGESLFKLVTAKAYYHVLNAVSEVPLPIDAGDFRLIDRKVINAFNGLSENNKYIRGLIGWVGFKQTPFHYEREARYAGSTKYTLRKMVRFASNGIFYFSKKPLKVATSFGFCAVSIGMLASLWFLFNKVFNPQYLVSGWTSLMLMVIFLGGVQLLTIGILGNYVGSLFDEIKRRPEYIVDETINLQLPEATQSFSPGFACDPCGETVAPVRISTPMRVGYSVRELNRGPEG